MGDVIENFFIWIMVAVMVMLVFSVAVMRWPPFWLAVIAAIAAVNL